MKHALWSVFALVLVACGTATHPASTPDGDTGSETCGGYGPNDACINPENFAQCQEREGECPGQVLVLESCPVQFACP